MNKSVPNDRPLRPILRNRNLAVLNKTKALLAIGMTSMDCGLDDRLMMQEVKNFSSLSRK